jgi:hypothetical protein
MKKAARESRLFLFITVTSSLSRHDPLYAGHPRLPLQRSAKKDVDGPDKPGHDEVGETPGGPHAALRFIE